MKLTTKILAAVGFFGAGVAVAGPVYVEIGARGEFSEAYHQCRQATKRELVPQKLRDIVWPPAIQKAHFSSSALFNPLPAKDWR